METTDGINIGQVVKSRAGRDKGNIFLVLDIIDYEYVLVVDGDLRKLEKPKKKKIKHLAVYKTVVSEFKQKIENNENINDSYVQRLLEPFKKKYLSNRRFD